MPGACLSIFHTLAWNTQADTNRHTRTGPSRYGNSISGNKADTETQNSEENKCASEKKQTWAVIGPPLAPVQIDLCLLNSSTNCKADVRACTGDKATTTTTLWEKKENKTDRERERERERKSEADCLTASIMALQWSDVHSKREWESNLWGVWLDEAQIVHTHIKELCCSNCSGTIWIPKNGRAIGKWKCSAKRDFKMRDTNDEMWERLRGRLARLKPPESKWASWPFLAGQNIRDNLPPFAKLLKGSNSRFIEIQNAPFKWQLNLGGKRRSWGFGKGRLALVRFPFLIARALQGSCSEWEKSMARKINKKN